MRPHEDTFPEFHVFTHHGKRLDPDARTETCPRIHTGSRMHGDHPESVLLVEALDYDIRDVQRFLVIHDAGGTAHQDQ